MVLLKSYLGDIWGEAKPRRPWEETCTVAGMFYGLILCSTTRAWRSPQTHLRRGDFIEQHVRSQCMCIQMKETPTRILRGWDPSCRKTKREPSNIFSPADEVGQSAATKSKRAGSWILRSQNSWGNRRDSKEKYQDTRTISQLPPTSPRSPSEGLTTTPQGTEDNTEPGHFAHVSLHKGQHLLQLGMAHCTSLASLVSWSVWVNFVPWESWQVPWGFPFGCSFKCKHSRRVGAELSRMFQETRTSMVKSSIRCGVYRLFDPHCGPRC